ncbi:polyprenol monophosphomannose synthase [Flavobacteriales bacterium]|jgi:dolichol-phosphate mannosyltransferase|nr:polyprenol monophosphomannose synthase [Flavobacteriales bacterium]
MSDSLVIIPTYNEKENIEKMIRTVHGLTKDFHVLIVDDGSPDGTAQIVKNLQKEFPESLHIEEREGKLGLGTAYIHGFKWGLEKGYDFIFEMDADFSHPVDKLPELYKACAKDGYDFSIGSRYVKGGAVSNWDKKRLFLSQMASLYSRIILWVKVKDTTAGFMCYSRKVLETMDLDKIKFIGYAFQIEMKYTAIRLGFKPKEVPITFKDREFGTSKMDVSIIKEAIIGVVKLKFKKISKKK